MVRTFNIGKKIKQFRLEKNYSQETLANELDLSQREISKIESNEVGLKVDMLVRIAEILDKNVSDFFPQTDRQVFHNVTESQLAYHKIVNHNEAKNYEDLSTIILEMKARFDNIESTLAKLSK
jgi:transcriptional regulator with XRE-family HTH domain